MAKQLLHLVMGGRVVDPQGVEFQVNTVTYLNQRSPSVAALENGGFVVAWVSEEFRQRDTEHVDIAARLFDAQGVAAGSDFALNSGQDICANPQVVATASGFRTECRSTAPMALGVDAFGLVLVVVGSWIWCGLMIVAMRASIPLSRMMRSSPMNSSAVPVIASPRAR